ncbi:MAG: DUF2914 domain-containing protein [Deltaproteobacteria bacterium]|nr:DUF2914 domain-containing protein [Deltaproteobacteria bacterium]
MAFPSKILALKQKHEKWIPLVFFAGGFTFDAYMLQRIDELFAILQQAAYIAVAGALICLNLAGYQPVNRLGARLWHYHEELMHFLLGTLLNAYTIFYFKASSSFTSIVFVVALCGVLYVNESKALRASNAAVRLGLLALCITSYLVCLVPILMGQIGTLPFLLSIFAATLAAAPFFWFLKRRELERQLLVPFAIVQASFLVLYFAELIPPVPLSLKYMGIYHGLTKKDGEYELAWTRSRWRFWQNGDQSFDARPGDKIYFFARVFSPTRFSEKLNVRWLHHGKQGWHAWDAIPMAIMGGREEGFRGYAVKSNYEPGDWRVQVETHDGRELGRIYFTVEADPGTDARETRLDRQ